MKEIKRLGAGAQLGNTPDGTMIVINVVDFDGGEFGLHPRITDDSLILVDPNRPNAYGARITGDPEALGRLGKALLTVQRNSRGEGDDSDEASE